jgi:hypothetical protein
LAPGELAQVLLPGALEAAGDQPVLRFYPVELPAGAVGLEAGLLDQQLPLRALGRPGGLALVERGQGGLEAGGRERLQDGGYDGVVQALAAKALAAVLGAV